MLGIGDVPYCHMYRTVRVPQDRQLLIPKHPLLEHNGNISIQWSELSGWTVCPVEASGQAE